MSNDHSACFLAKGEIDEDFAETFYRWFALYDPEGVEIRNVREHISFEDKIVLEVGCGTGKMSIQACRDARAYFGVDIDPRLIALCKRKYFGQANLSFIYCNGEDLLFRDAFFDIVYMPWVISYFSDRERALFEAARVLRTDGKFVLLNDSDHSDFDVVLERVNEYEPHNPEQDYEAIISQYFSIDERIGPFDVPYHFPSLSEAHRLFMFIVEQFFGFERGKYSDLISASLTRYVKKEGDVILNERPLLYVCSKLNGEDAGANEEMARLM